MLSFMPRLMPQLSLPLRQALATPLLLPVFLLLSLSLLSAGAVYGQNSFGEQLAQDLGQNTSEATNPNAANEPASNSSGFSGFAFDSGPKQAPEFLPVEEAYELDLRLDAEGRLQLNWFIQPGYYLYKHRFDIEVSHNGKPIALSLDIPRGEAKDDPYFGPVEAFYTGVTLNTSPLPANASINISHQSQGCADAGLCYPPRTLHYHVDTASGAINAVETASAINEAPFTPSSGPAQAQPLWLIIALALLGGAILNLMPCVFPVLGLKLMSFTHARGNTAVHGLSYSAGVVLSFVAIAGLLLALRASGQALGWGFQLQSPEVVGALALLFFALGLNLLGSYEISGAWTGSGQGLTEKPGYRGSFFTGVLATLVATPCTAPFMGTALGYAVTQPPVIALTVFAALGAGMALPMLALALSPGLLAKLPKPGPWMDTSKQVLAFPLLATSLWLAWVAGRQVGVNAMLALGIACLLLAIAAWAWRKAWKPAALIAVLAALAMLASPLMQPSANTVGKDRGFSMAEVQALRDGGQAVFVDVTADWCITCASNEALVLNTERIQNAFRERNIAFVVADWTNYDPAITALLEQYQRSGIPLYLLFEANSSAPARLLPQILSQGIVLDALDSLSPQSPQN